MRSERRVQRLLSHLCVDSSQPHSLSLQPTSHQYLSDDDIVIASAVRTPICKAKRGGLASVHWAQLLSTVMSSACHRAGINPEMIEDIQVGTVLAQGGGAHPARMAQFIAGIPETTCLATLNRQCSSGLQAIANVAAAIRAGYIQIGMAAGVESMSSNDMMSAIGPLDDCLLEHPKSKQCLIPMGITSELVAERFGITRDEQDEFAVRSHQRALKAQTAGIFESEIVPIPVKTQDQDGSTKEVIVSCDDGIRETSLETLAKMRPAFKKDGTTTAANASQVSDGAAATILMTRKRARELGVKPMARFIAFSIVGVPPDVMGIGPAFAIPKVLRQAGLSIENVDIFELNEAFASQAVYCIKKLGLDIQKVNPLGGAIALGHPLGATGVRQLVTLINQMKRTSAKYGVVSMCVGTGMGAAAVFAAE